MFGLNIFMKANLTAIVPDEEKKRLFFASHHQQRILTPIRPWLYFLPLLLTATVSLSMLQEQGIPIWALLSILITHASPPVIQVYFKIHNYIWKE